MKYFFKREWKWLLIVLVVFITTLGLLLIKTKYEIITPAVISPVDSYITIKTDDENNADINTTSVYGFYNINALNYIIARLNPFVDEYIPSSALDTSDAYIQQQGTLHRELSIKNAIVSSYQKAGYSTNIKYKGYVVTSIYHYENIENNFELEDLILKVDDLELSLDFSLVDAIRKIRSVDSSKTKFNCAVDRGNEELVLVLELYEKNDKYYSCVDAEVDYYYSLSEDAPEKDDSLGDSIGPSGGLMQALYVYEKLTGCKLTKGLKIAGTGTIDVHGNVGLIGGMKQKIYTANANNVDIFFVPVDKSYEKEEDQLENWTEAEEAYDKLLFTDMKIVPVSSLQDVISYLEGLK